MIAVRPIARRDADGFAALVRRVFLTVDVDPAPSAARLTGGDVRAHLDGGGGGVIAEVECPVAGLLWNDKAGGLYVSRVTVDPGWQRQGLATRLLAAAEAEAARRRLPCLWLSTRLALTSNRQLFGRYGFVETVRHAHPGYAEPTFVDMVKAFVHGAPTLHEHAHPPADELTLPRGV